MDNSAPALSALLRDLSTKQLEIVRDWCAQKEIPILDFVDQAVLEKVKRYLAQHQGEDGNGWMREKLALPIFSNE